jgi:hypothetical protein
MGLRQLMIMDLLSQHRNVLFAGAIVLPIGVFMGFKGIPVGREPLEGTLVRYGLSSSSWANGQVAWVDVREGRTVIAYHDPAKPYIAPGARVKMQELTDLWGFRWYIIDHQATSQPTDTP